MPTITQFMQGRRWTLGPAPDYYFPNSNHPHLHLRVRNGQTFVNDETDVRRNINFLSITFGGAGHDIQIYPIPNNGGGLEWKRRIGDELQRYFPNNIIEVQREVNTLTGLGIDTNS